MGLLRSIFAPIICTVKGHRHGDLYHWEPGGPFIKYPGCLRCKTQFSGETTGFWKHPDGKGFNAWFPKQEDANYKIEAKVEEEA